MDMETFQDVVCPVCGCLCDDIEVQVEGNKVVKAKNACAMGTSKFLNYPNDRIASPKIKNNGSHQSANLEDAVDKIADMLVKAKYPVIYGLSLSSCEAIKVALELAEEIGGVLDNQTTVCHGPGVQGLHDIGESTCSLGEVKHRADLIVCWGANLAEAHPRHFARYSYTAKGRFRKGKEDRKLIVVDVRKTPTAKMADKFIQLEQGKDYELINALRTALRLEQIQLDSVAGIPVEEIEELAEDLRSCEFGALFYGQGVTQTRGKGRNIDALFSLARDLNNWTKFNIMPARGHYNVTGVNQVSAWQTGFPYGIDFSQGYPWYNPGETTIVDILRRGESDATLVVGSDPIAHFPPDVSRRILGHPLAAIDPANSLTTMVADIIIPSSFSGIESEGIAYRMDGVALNMTKVVEPPSSVLSDEEILKMILAKVKELRGPN
jgi:formylmethanofuran dehydrogenase subunit B